MTDVAAAEPPPLADGGSPPPAPPAAADVTERRLRVAILVLLAVRVAALLLLLATDPASQEGGITGDVRRYQEMATADGTAYADFQVEYPPITYLAIQFLAGPDLAKSIAAVAISQFLCDVAIAAVLWRVWGTRSSAAYLLLGVPLILWPFIYARIDLLAVLLAVGGMALIRRGSPTAGAAGLAAAVLTKIWPFVLAPVLVVERRWRAVASFVFTGLVLGGAWIAVAGVDGVRQVVSFRDATGWQVESLPGVLWHLRDPSRIKFESGAFRTGVMPIWARPMLTLLSLAFVALAWWLADRRRREGAADHVLYAWAPLASVLAMLLFAPILSPQYVVWFLPFAAITAARGDRVVGALTLAVTALTTISYPLVLSASEGALWAILPVLARNLALVALIVVALQSLAGHRREPRRLPSGTDALVSS
jgi:hypothetical protein